VRIRFDLGILPGGKKRGIAFRGKSYEHGDEADVPDDQAEILVNNRQAVYLKDEVSRRISVVTQQRDRREHLERMLDSLRAAALPDGTELQVVVADYDAEDAGTKELVESRGAIHVPAGGPYNRAAGRNLGARWADGSVVVFLDADMVVPPGFFHAVLEEVRPGRAFFPVCRDAEEGYDHGKPLEGQRGKLGRARSHGYGNCALTLADLEKAGPWNEDHSAWGREDTEFYGAASAALDEVARYELVGLVHQAHPRDEGFLNRHASADAGRMTLLVKFPTRGRPDKFFEVLDLYVAKASGRHDVKFLVSCDADDEAMNTPEVRKRLKSYGAALRFRFGDNADKIAAVNADMGAAWKRWDVILLASDDMIPERDGYDEVICDRMRRYFPDLDGVLWFNDGYCGRKLNTLSIMGRAYYERFGYLYHPDYKSIWADNEFMDVANLLGRQVYFDDVLIRHAHPCNAPHEAKKDATYDLNSRYDAVDGRTYLERRDKGFDLDLSPVLSVLVCTLDRRRGQFEALRAKLAAQAVAVEEARGRRVEVLHESDDGAMPIGAKRNVLLRRARGDYVCFVDDDDDVDDEYLSLLVDACLRGAPDCVGIAGRVKDGGKWREFTHSLKHARYWDDNRGYYRPPNHLNPVRRAIAVRYPFKATDWAEDYDWAMHLAEDGALRTEVMVEKPLYFYSPSPGHDGSGRV
jgi:glycosyltransferase involved in cell wall biosynthesis